MKSSWQTKKLGDVCAVGAGNSAPQQKEFFNNGSYPFFRTSDVGAIHVGQIRESNDYLNESGIKKMRLLKKGTILFPKSGASTFLNHRVIMEVDGYASSHLATIKTDESVLDNYYLFYFLQEIKAQDLIQDHKYPSLNLSVIEGMKISFPESLTEQRAIVRKLDQVFKKVVTAKEAAEKNLQNAKELFESYLQSLKGDKTELGKLVDIKTGKLNANAMEEGGQYPFFTCAKEIYAIDKYAFDCEAILLAGNNAVGDFNVKHYKGKFNAYQRTYVITVNEQHKVLYRYLYFQLLKSLKEFKVKSVGSGTKFLKLGMIQGLGVTLPSLAEQKIIVKKLGLLLKETEKLEKIYEQKIADLEELKKSVLASAFAGKL